MRLAIKITSDFKKDLKRATRRGKDKNKMLEIVSLITAGEPLPVKAKDHLLCDSKYYKNDRECHVEPDWLLVYCCDYKTQELLLIRTGSHSDLFK
ncbi:MAG TPA: type II toxin-antitoxin system YafQ family toxin [Bacilli bacterium]|nr:type II toxin-antitoxin system YafQ family toxin [Bacilli bacterium]